MMRVKFWERNTVDGLANIKDMYIVYTCVKSILGNDG